MPLDSLISHIDAVNRSDGSLVQKKGCDGCRQSDPRRRNGSAAPSSSWRVARLDEGYEGSVELQRTERAAVEEAGQKVAGDKVPTMLTEAEAQEEGAEAAVWNRLEVVPETSAR